MLQGALKWACFAVAILTMASGSAGDLSRAQPPQELGFSAERLDYIDRFYADKVKQGQLAGIVTLITRHGKVAHFSAVGYADVEKKRRLEKDAIFRLYSMTKPIASTALMMLYEEGRFQMRDPLDKYIPELANLRVLRTPDSPLGDTVPLERAPTVQDVLRHTAGFSHGGGKNAVDAEYIAANVFGIDVTLEQIVSKLAKIPLLAQPGTKYIYSVGPDIQGRLVEILSGMPFDEFLDKRLFKPLGMKDTGFWLGPDKAGRLAAVHWAKQGRLTPLDEAHGYPPEVVKFIADPRSVNSYTFNHKRKGGSYGLVSTAEDYWRFAQMMLNGGELDGTRILSPQVVRYMTRDHLQAIGIKEDLFNNGFGLGFAVIDDPAAAGFMSSPGTYYWAGAAETHFWIDPQLDMVVVAMTQHLGAPSATALWPELRTLVYSALLE